MSPVRRDAPFWITAFLDLPRDDVEDAVAFWRQITGYDVSSPRGSTAEFASFLPPVGGEHLKVQGTDEGPARIHLDLHVTDVRRAADRAITRGADEVTASGHIVLRSPGGLPFCLVSHPATHRPPPARWPGGRSQVDQVCLDIPAPVYAVECAFWHDLTGWRLSRSTQAPEFSRLRRPVGHPLRLLLQEVGDEAMGAHLDLSCDDRTAEADRHVAAGATVERVHEHWTVLTDPTGMTYCITDRTPDTD